MAFNYNAFFTASSKVRGGKFVWVKDASNMMRRNVPFGSSIANPYKGVGYAWAGDLYEYHVDSEGYLFRSFAVAKASAAADTTIYLGGDGYSCIPEVGNVLMVAPDTVDATGQSGKVTGVTYDETNSQFVVTLDTAIGALTTSSILVEAAGTAASATASVLVKNPNTFVEVDTPFMPTDSSYGIDNVQFQINTIYGQEAWIARMQPLPKYVLAKNRSYIDGIFEL